MLRWKATAASPHSPPATIVIASSRCRSFGMRRASQAKKREKRPSTPTQYFNCRETSLRRLALQV